MIRKNMVFVSVVRLSVLVAFKQLGHYSVTSSPRMPRLAWWVGIHSMVASRLWFMVRFAYLSPVLLFVGDLHTIRIDYVWRARRGRNCTWNPLTRQRTNWQR